MDYIETIDYVMNNITTQKDLYVNINNKTRIHVYTQKRGSVDWYEVECQILENNHFVSESKMSASELSDLRHIVGVAWIHLNTN